MRQTLIFWPMIAHAFLVFGLYFELGRRRYIAGSRKEIHVKNFRVPKPDSDSEYSGAAARVVINNFEMPTLFYAACLALFLVSAVNLATLFLAWVFIIARVLQAMTHLTYNDVFHRGGWFFLSVFMTMGLWIALAIHLITT